MEKKFDTLVKYILDSITTDSLTDGAVYEFTNFCCNCVQESVQPDWTGYVVELWDYLAASRTMPVKENAAMAFRLGQLYASLNLLQSLQRKKAEESVLKEDAHTYFEHWYKVFTALESGNSLTHGELAGACSLSDSSLSQFLHKIDGKNYIHSRKVGRTKYYRLSDKGKLLLQQMHNEHKLTHLDVKASVSDSVAQASKIPMLLCLPLSYKHKHTQVTINIDRAIYPDHKLSAKQLEKNDGARIAYNYIYHDKYSHAIKF